jgi:cell filamentation protein
MALFDPFGDFETAGYLQNAEGYRTASAVKRFEHREHQKALPGAIAALQARDRLTYQDILDTHGRLFGRVYPTWAGKDRLITLPHLNIHKGSIIFAPPLISSGLPAMR